MTESDSDDHRKPRARAKDDGERSHSASRGDDYSDDRKRRKKKKTKRRKERRRSYDSVSADDHSDDASADERNHRRHKSRKSKRKSSSRSKYDSGDSDGYSSTSSDDSREPRHKKKKKKRSRRDDYSTSSSSDSNRKRKRHRKDKKKKKVSSKSKKDTEDNTLPTFGKYGILKASDYHKEQTQRSFTIWMEEVKGIGAFTGPKWELQEYYKEYMEDYNTATFPHDKYYNYDKWEMEEYEKNKAKLNSGATSELQRDEVLHRRSLQQQTEAKRKEERAFALSLMSKEKVEEMKRKKQLESEMAHAYKIGDQATYQRLKNRLEPEK
jgi:hypothetical protein